MTDNPLVVIVATVVIVAASAFSPFGLLAYEDQPAISMQG